MTAKIRFKGHSWEHNPETLKLSLSDNLSEQKLAGSRSLVKSSGTGARRVSGEGQFCGENCLHDFSELLRLQSERGSGILSLPGIKPFYAFFSGIRLLCEPSPDVITYAFEFVEDTSRVLVSHERFHQTQPGQTLWDISYIYNIAIEKLVKLNPQIKRVDEIEGERVRLC